MLILRSENRILYLCIEDCLFLNNYYLLSPFFIFRVPLNERKGMMQPARLLSSNVTIVSVVFVVIILWASMVCIME